MKESYSTALHTVTMLLLTEKHRVETSHGKFRLEDETGLVNEKALGYIFGFVDSALQLLQLELKNKKGFYVVAMAIEVMVPGSSKKYFKYLCMNMDTSEHIQEGVTLGFNEFKEFMENKGTFVPMGFINCFD